jgi:molybdenum cofactor biosynthesis enzyme MoaA
MWKPLALQRNPKTYIKGKPNINTNGSNPNSVRALCEAGLNSIRVSMNSARKNIYESIIVRTTIHLKTLESLRVMPAMEDGLRSLLCFPGMTDSVEEYEALRKLVQ